MPIEDFITLFANACERPRDSISAASDFKNFETWDSLNVLAIIAMVDERYRVSLTGEEIENAKTVQDLWDVIQQKR